MHKFCEVKLIFYALIISLVSYIINTINKLLFLSELYLDHDVESWFAEKARIKGVELQSLINELLRKDISLIQEVTGKN